MHSLKEPGTDGRKEATVPRPTSWVKRLLREPLVHFLAASMALFVVYRAMNPETGAPNNDRRITLTEDDLTQMTIAWLAQGRSTPTPEQMQQLLNTKIREEILHREAIALGLDQEDAIIKRRLVQKMEFLAEDLSDLAEPTDEELRAFLKENPQRFALPARVSFRHVYFSPDRNGERTRDVATATLATLGSAPRSAAELSSVGDPFMFQDAYADRTFTQLATLFGPQFAKAVFGYEPGTWNGPIQSGYGWHLVWIDSATQGRVPDFEEIEPSVKSEWVSDRREEAKRKMFETMRARYEIVLPEPRAKAGK